MILELVVAFIQAQVDSIFEDQVIYDFYSSLHC